jgi:uncharacterized Ntn-hydrolase superfamily protein
MRNVFWILLPLIFLIAQATNAQSTPKSSKKQYGFIIVLNKEAAKLIFSPVFEFEIDKRGDPVCDLGKLEHIYREKVADEKFDVLTSDYFDTKEEAVEARGFYIASEKKAGRAVTEPNTLVGECI